MDHIGNTQFIQKMNRLNVLSQIRLHAPVSRVLLSKETGLSLSSITNIVTYLLEKELVVETALEQVDRVGRKGILLQLNDRRFDLVCVRLYEQGMHVAITDLNGNIRCESLENMPRGDYHKTIKKIVESIRRICKGRAPENMLGVCVAVSGLVLSAGRVVTSSSQNWNGVNLHDDLAAELKGLPVFVENISITKAMYELHKENGANGNALFLDLDNGVGAIQILNGAVNRTVIGEVGHTTVERNGPLCACGNRGCLEVMCSLKRVVEEYNAGTGRALDYDGVLRAAAQKDARALELLGECGEYLGIGIANLVNIFYPSVIYIHGDDYFKSAYLMEKATACMRGRIFPVLTEGLALHQTEITDADSIFGIAMNLCDRIFDISYSNGLMD